MTKKSKRSHLEFSVDPDCLHCAILKSVHNYANEHSNGKIFPSEIVHSLIICLVDIYNQMPNNEIRNEMEEDMLNNFQKCGFKWTQSSIQ